MLSNEVSCWPSFSSTVPDYLWETAVSAVQIFWQGQIQIHAITPCFMFRIYLVLITVVMPISASFFHTSFTAIIHPSLTVFCCFFAAMSNAKLAQQMEERQRLDTLRFKKAGQGPIQKTYSYDPTGKTKPSSSGKSPVSAKPRS